MKIILLSSALTLLLAFVLSATTLKGAFELREKEDLELTITAMAKKQEISGGTEVRIRAIIVDNTTLVDLPSLAEKYDGWTMEGELLYAAYNLQEAVSLQVTLPEAHKVYVSMVGQGGSGVVEIACGGKTEQIDLYRESWVTVGWEYSGSSQYTLQNHMGLLLIIWGIVELGFLIIWQIATKKIVHLAVQTMFCSMMVGIIAILLLLSNRNYALKTDVLAANWVIVAAWILILILIASLGRAKGRALSAVRMDCDKIVNICTMCLLFLQIYVSFNIFFITDWDAGQIMRASELYAFGDPKEALQAYVFSRYQNNLMLMFVYAICLKINHIMGVFIGDYQFMSVAFLNCLINCASCMFVYKAAKLFVTPQKAMIAFIGAVALFGISPWSTICYTDAIGLVFPILSFYLYATAKRKGKNAHIFLSVIVACIGYYIKPQCIIVFLAILALETMKMFQEKGSRNLRIVLSMLACAFLCLVSLRWGMNADLKRNGTALDNNVKFTWTHMYFMGLNSERNGVYREGDVKFSDYFADCDAREEGNLEKAAERLRNMGGVGLARHTAKKVLTNYNNGTFGWGMGGVFFDKIFDPPNSVAAELLRNIYYMNGMYYKWFAAFEQFVWLGILLFAFFASVPIKNHGLDPLVSVLMLSIIGLTAFELLFEAGPRYLYIYAPIFCVLAAIGTSKLSAVWDNCKKSLMLKR